MPFTPVLAVAEKSSTSVMDALPHLAGMLMVMGTLAILWGICALTAKLVRLFIPEPAPAAAPLAKPAANPQPAPDPKIGAEIAPEIIAVIAAAIASTTSRSHRIVSIQPMSSSWEKAGRQSVLTSHRIR